MARTGMSALAAVAAAVLMLGARAFADAPATQPATQPAEVSAAWPPGFMMDMLGAFRKPIDDLGLRVYGAVEAGFTGNLIGGQRVLPGRGFDARRPNNLRLHQLRLVLERPYDTSKSFDIGGRIEGIFGGDAKITHSQGLFDKAGHGNGDAWADLYQAYGQLWFKTGKESGLEVTVGKFASPMGFEATAAEASPLYSHSFVANFTAPGAHAGVKLNYILNSQASVFFGVHEGWDVWNDNNDALSYIVGGALSGAEQIDGHARDSLAWCVLTGPEQQDNVSHNRTSIDLYFTHYYTAALSQTLEGNIGLEEGVPGVGYAKWYGVANYFTYAFSKHLSATWRAEWFRDQGGSRTGADAAWYSNTFGFTVTACPDHPVFRNLSFRPELRWDYASQEAFGGDRRNQLTLGMDVIFKF